LEVAWPVTLLSSPVVSYTAISPLPFARENLGKGRYLSVVLFASYLARALPGNLLCGARTFLRRNPACDRPANLRRMLIIPGLFDGVNVSQTRDKEETER